MNEELETDQPEVDSGALLERVCALLSDRGPMTCTEIGETLWGGKRHRQAYARPAGKIIKKLRDQGRVKQHWPKFRKAGDAPQWTLSNAETQP